MLRCLLDLSAEDFRQWRGALASGALTWLLDSRCVDEPLLAIKVQGDATLCTSDSVALLPQDMTRVSCMLLLIGLVKACPLNKGLESLFIASLVHVCATAYTLKVPCRLFQVMLSWRWFGGLLLL